MIDKARNEAQIIMLIKYFAGRGKEDYPFNARQIFSGVAGISIILALETPADLSALTIAFIIVGSAAIVPDSPAPLTPIALVRHGTG